VTSDRDRERRNRQFWNDDADDYQAVHARDLGRAADAWGVWRIPEADLQVLGEVDDRDVLEFGCGAAQWSIALAERGARPVGLDQSIAQLRHAGRLQREHRIRFPLICASATNVPFSPSSFDVIFADHGAFSFCDPVATIAEAGRLLRPGGRLVFCHATPLLYLTWDPSRERHTRKLRRTYFGMRTFDSDEGTVDYVLPTGEWIQLFRANDLAVEALVELRPPEHATTSFEDFVPHRWARRWPAEQIWVVSKPFAP
jgi:SAM-dependent methyltransferase